MSESALLSLHLGRPSLASDDDRQKIAETIGLPNRHRGLLIAYSFWTPMTNPVQVWPAGTHVEDAAMTVLYVLERWLTADDWQRVL